MARKVLSGLIQASNPINDESRPVAEIQAAMLEKHLPMIHDAGKRGVQILCLQEIFNGPYFCPGQDRRWYDAAEPVPGPTVAALAPIAAKYQMAMVVPLYEREQAGIYYNTAAILDADGSYLGKYRKTHIPQTSGFWEKYFFRPGNLGYPVFKTRYATIGVVHLLRPPLPRGRPRAGPRRRRDRLQPVGHGGRAVAAPVEARAAGPRDRQRLLRRRDQPRRHRGAVEHRQVLRQLVLREPARRDPRLRLRGQDELVVADLDLDLIEEVRRTWQFFRDRRPDAYGPLVEE
jgi:beta-ureidopropionase